MATIQALVNCGGGGLVSGCAIALQARLPGIKIYTVKPEDFDDTGRSLTKGERVCNETSARSICDALLAETPGRLPFEILVDRASGGLVVSDAEVRQAMRFAFQNLKIVVEPGGAVALAAVLSGRIDTAGKTTAIIFSGGNVDTGQFASIQSEPA